MKKVYLFAMAFLFLQVAAAQPSPLPDAAKIKLKMEKLNVLGSVLYIAAHPDDENTHLLGFLSNEKKYRTGYLALTRGSGGQNLIGNEQSPYIGLIRTEELLAARRQDGAEQFFSSAFDFGFSRTAKETLEFWDHDQILSDVVWIIRKFKPDILLTRFPEDERAGHGNHWASAILAHEAFEAAADPDKFPEQLTEVEPWQAKRIMWNTYRFGDAINTTSKDQFQIEDGGFNPLLGKSYGEIAAEGRNMHKSQGFGTAPTYGQQTEYFELTEGPAPEKTLMDGINTSWSRVDGGEELQKMVEEVNASFNPDRPDESLPLLAKIHAAVKKTGDPYWKEQKLKEVEELMVDCAAIRIGVYAESPYVVAGESIKVEAKAIKMSDFPVTMQSINVFGEKEQTLNVEMRTNKFEGGSLPLTIPTGLEISQPYWLKEPHTRGHYIIKDQDLIGRPRNPNPLMVKLTLRVAGETIALSTPVEYKQTNPVRGELIDPLVIVPEVTANLKEDAFIFPKEEAKEIEVLVRSFKDHVEGIAHIEAPSDFTIEKNDQSFSFDKKGESLTLHFFIKPNGPISQSKVDELKVELKVGEKVYSKGILEISYEHIPKITAFPEAAAKLTRVPLELKTQKVGYIMGSGDKIPEALSEMGIRVDLLSDRDIREENLKQYDAVVVGIRAYNVRKGLKNQQEELMNYVKEGGVLVAQYNKPDVVLDHLGPYPFKINPGNSQRVTEEDAKVTFNTTGNSILNAPNKITEEDFDGWVQERGLYFVDFVDSRYSKPLIMHDEGEEPLYGSIIYSDYGKGKYVYTGLSFFRQLPAGVPGAFRLFANLLAP